MHFLLPSKFLDSQYKINLAELFAWIKRWVFCCIFFTLICHILALYSPPLLSLNSLDLYRRKPLFPTFTLNTECRPGSWIASFIFKLKLYLALNWDQNFVWEAKLANILRATLKTQPPIARTSSGGIYGWWMEMAVCPDASPGSPQAAEQEEIPSDTRLSPCCTRLCQEMQPGAALLSLPHTSHWAFHHLGYFNL